ncbi:amino acid adenylation domain-containing protein [Paenibacillus sp. S-38]|uniref:amino acid adenylation domain-containing protein n=1 Tax=Paenibacillus sp. S-38 TaxID=3416710 RepID=UPI003CEE3F6C
MKSLTDRIHALTPEQRALLEKKVKALQAGSAPARSSGAVIPRRNHTGPSPLSYDQERLWFFCRIHPESYAYNVYGSARIKGSLNHEALTNSINETIKRHEAWRTVFDRNLPLQIVLPELHVDVPVVDLRQEPAETKEVLVQKLVQEEVQRLFDLYEGPLVRFKLFRLSEEEMKLVLTVHHMVTDKITFTIFYDELVAQYNAFVNGQEVRLPEPSIQYADFAEWQRNDLQGEKREKLLSFWKEELQGCQYTLDLPTDFPRPPSMSFRGSRLVFHTPKEVVQRLAELAKQENATVFMALLTAFTILLYRYTGQSDILVGTPIANRNQVELERVLGYFLTMGTLRSRLSGEMTVRELLQRVRETAKGVFNHQDLPVGLLLDELRIPNDPSRNPLIQAVFLYIVKEKIDLTGLDIQPELIDGETVRYDITLCAAETDDGLDMFIEYPTDLFREETIERMAAHWNQLLHSMGSGPHQALSALDMLTEEERARIVHDWNQTQADYPSGRTLHELFEEQVCRTPDAVAVICEEKQWTYRMLDERANRIAEALKGLNVRPDQIVGLLLKRSLGMLAAIWGVLKSGAAYCPIDPDLPQDRVRTLIEDSELRILLTQDELTDEASYDEGVRVMFMDDEGVMLENDMYRHLDEGGDETGPQPVHSADNLAYLIYTSGSTGRPKGVMVEHRSVVNFIYGMLRAIPFREQMRVLSVTTYGFDPFVLESLLPLITGASVILASEHERRDPEALSELIIKQQVEVMQTTPARMHQLLQVSGDRSVLAGLKHLLLGGEAMPASLAAKIRALTEAAIYNMYGPTETTVWSTMAEITDVHSKATIGTPIANMQIYIMDRTEGSSQLQPIGVPGELCIAGYGLARGYLQRPELTAEKFVPHPFEPGQRLYRTGDLAKWLPDGTIEYLGRTDHQVKIRGYRIELGEIEAQMMRIEAVKEAVVIVGADASGSRQLCTYFTASSELAGSYVKKQLASKLPSYMIPAYLIQTERLPVNVNGKIDRKALSFPQGGGISEAEYVPPRTAEERLLLSLWELVLGASRAGIRDNFFDLGGDSIHSIQLSSRLYEAGYRLNMQDLFEYPTVAELAPRLQRVQRMADQGEVTGPVERTPAWQWFLEQRWPAPQRFSQSVVLHKEEGFDEQALRRALAKLTEHHDALRIVFRLTEAGPVAYNRSLQEGDSFSLEVVQLQGSSDPLAAFAEKEEEIRESIDLANGPLLKAGLFRAADGDHLLLVIHHYVVDGYSWRILLAHLATAYDYALRQEPIRLPYKTDSFQAWASKLAGYANTQEAQQECIYWKDMEHHTIQPLPKDDVRQDSGAAQGSAVVTVCLPSQETELLLNQANRAYGTQVDDLLIAALLAAVHDWTGMSRALIRLEDDGRRYAPTELDTSLTVGWFTSLYPVALPTYGDAAVDQRIKHVKEHLRRVPRHGAGYGILRYLSAPSEGAGLQAEPEILFSYSGELDQALPDRSFRLSPFYSPQEISLHMAAHHALNVDASVRSGMLEVSAVYDSQLFRQSTVEALAAGMLSHLREIIAHCTACTSIQLTPSDVLLPGLLVEDLERLALRTASIGELENVFPLSPMQQGILFHTLLRPQSNAYCEQSTFVLRGSFDIPTFAESLEALMQRHEVLRTNFYTDWWKEPVQAVFRRKRSDLHVEDVRHMAGDEQDVYVHQFMQTNRARGFKLDREPLLRVSILRTDEHTYRFIWNFHHIIVDGWCVSQLTNEVFEIYFAKMEQRRPDLEAVAPYSQYIQWLASQDREAAAQYWSGYLSGYERRMRLPSSMAQEKNEAEGYEARTLYSDLGAGLTKRLGIVAKQYKVTLNTLLQTVWGLLLQRYNYSSDVVFGAVVSGRPAEIPGIERMIGLFINTIPVRMKCEAEEVFTNVLRRMQEQAVASHAYDTFPLYEIQNLSEQKQELLHHLFIFQNYPMEERIPWDDARVGFQISSVETEEQTNYNFNLVIYPGDSLKICYSYNALAYDPASIQRIQRHWVHLLEQVAANPERKLSELETVTAEERAQIFEVFNAVSACPALETTIHGLLEEQAERTPDQTAVFFEGKRLSYRELNERSNRLARTLRSCGVSRDVPVGLMAERSLEMIVGMFAILKAGGAYVPMDPEYPADRLRYMLEDTEAAMLLTQASLRERVAAGSCRTILLDDPDAYAANGSNLESVSSSDDLAYVIYTSGTTGVPKGVMVEHRGLVNLKSYFADTMRIGENDRVLLFASLSFDAACWEIFQSVFCGATLYVPASPTLLNYGLFTSYVTEHQVTVASLPPAYAMHLEPEQLPSLRILLTAGASSTRELVYTWKNRVAYYNGYGPTENSIATSIWPVPSEYEADGMISIGRPVPGHRVCITDPQGGLLPVGVPGELCVAGVGLARGYWNLPELTAEKFVTSRFSGERMYRTGDLARWLPNGRLEHLGRIDHQVKVRGYRIEPEEIEAKLLQTEAVREAVVMAMADENGHSHLCAYYVASRELAASELRSSLRGMLPDYMIPSYLMQVAQMPLTPNGKIDRKALPDPDPSSLAATTYMSARTSIEHTLAAAWQSVLGVQTVGIHDHFFDLGGDSIKSMQVSSRLLQAGYKLEMRDLFAHPTIAEVSAYVQKTDQAADQGAVTGDVRLTPIQHWFFAQNFTEPHYFNQAVMLHRTTGFEEGALRQALAAIAAHHDALRLVFRQADSGYRAWGRDVHEGEMFQLETFDFCGKTTADAAKAVEERAAELQGSFNLAEGPLMKLRLFRYTDGDHLLIVIHHLVVDGVSWRILLEDLTAAYEQAAQGEGIRLPPKTASFQSWARMLAVEAKSAAMQQERAYWLRMEQAERTWLPKDYCAEDTQAVSCRMQVADSDTLTAVWPEPMTQLLLKQANRAYRTEVHDLLLAALGMAIYAWSGLERVLLNVEGHGREPLHQDQDVTRTVGWFTSQYPVWLVCEANETTSQRIKRVKEELRRIPRKGAGYGMLRYLSELCEPGLFSAEPEISFNYLGQFDQDLQSGAMRLSPFSTGPSMSGTTVMKHVLNINGLIADGCLTMEIQYSSAAFRRETIERFAELLQASLQEVIMHCAAKEQPELTPSDVKLSGVTLEQFAAITEHAASTGEIEQVYGLTPMQKGMLFHDLMDPDSAAYFEQATFDVEGSFHVDVFAQSLDQLVQRHAVLRTNVFSSWEQEPVQIVYRDKRSEFYYEDLRRLPSELRRSYVQKFASEDKSRRFDLASGMLMRVAVLQTDDEAFSVIWSFHHIIMDGWCLSLINKEVFGTYFAILKGLPAQLAPVSPFSRYMEWLERQDFLQARDYWIRYLNGYEGQTLLPGRVLADKPAAGYEAGKRVSSLGKSLSASLNRTARQCQVTIHTVMQTAWGMVLQRYNNSRDVVFGSVVSGRPAEIPGIETMIGLFMNTVPVRVKSETEDIFSELLKRNQRQAIDSHVYDTHPLYEIQAQTIQKTELIGHLLIFENYPLDREIESSVDREGDGFTIVNAEMTEQTNYDFTLTIMPDEEIVIEFGYNALVYERGNVEQMQGHFIRVLEQIAEQPDMRVDEVTIVTSQEQELLLQDFNSTEVDYPHERTISALFEEQAACRPNRTAVRCADGELTYGELNEHANRLARTLRSSGIQPGDRVGLLTDRSLQMIIGIYAILKAGGAYVPMDPSYPDGRIRYMLEDSGAKLILAQRQWLARVPVEQAGIAIDLHAAESYAADVANLPPLAGPGDPAYVMYTSGSTGKPKGVMIEHRSVVNRLFWMQKRYQLTEADVILQKTAITFDVSVWELFWWAMAGSSVCLLSVGGEKSPERMVETIAQYGVTTVHFVPPMLREFLDYADQQSGSRLAEQLGTLRYVFASGDVLRPQHAAQFQKTLAWINRARLINLYGPTEATVDVSYFECDPDTAYSLIPIGKPIDNTRLYIMKEGTLQLQPLGVPGELCIAGAGVARGYVNRPELTAEKFMEDPFRTGERMYRSGDLARWLPDGNLEYLGRIDRQVKIRGYRIELGEVEWQLLNEENVSEAVVVAGEDDGAGLQHLCAYYVAKTDISASELRSRLAAKVPSYMVPTYLMQIERMPLSANGKIDRKALPAPQGAVRTEAAVMPRTRTESMLARIWQDILGLNRVGVTDHFFNIGGHSLRATALVTQIQRETGIAVPLRIVFERPTIETLAAWIRHEAQGEAEAATVIPLAEEQPYYPLSSAQKRMYILSQWAGGDIGYNMPSAMLVEGPLNRVRLEEVFRQLIARHESLRTGFEMLNGEPVQKIYDAADFAICTVQANEEEALHRLRHFVRMFDLRKPPLLRVELIELEAERHILQFDMHHIVSDGVSIALVMEELNKLYTGERLPPLGFQYKDYAVWQAQQEESKFYRQQEAYWLNVLSGELPVLELPTDYPRPEVRCFEGKRVAFEFDSALTVQVKELAEENGSTLFMVLLAAYTALLAHYSGQEDIIVGTPVAGRQISGLETIVGMFVNTLALRNYPTEEKTFRAYLQEVKESALGAYEHQAYPFDELVDKLGAAQHANRNPLFDTMLVLQNYEQQTLQIEKLRFTPLESELAIARFDLTVTVMEEEGRIVGNMDYSSKLFQERTVRKLADDLSNLLSIVAAMPDIRLGDIQLTEPVTPVTIDFLL